MAINRLMKYVPFLLVIGILIFSPSTTPLPNVSAAQNQLLNDNNTPASFFGSWQAGHIAGAVLTPEAFMYPVRVLSVDFVLYNGFPGATSSVEVRVCIYAMDNGVPDSQLGCSASTSITAFDPNFVSVSLPFEIILNSPDSFMAAVEYVSGAAGTTPSTLCDSNTNIMQGKNFYSFDGGSSWYEHYDVWTEPDQIGCNIIRATVDTNYSTSFETLFLPVALKNWQSIPPDPPVLNSISNPDGGGSYNVNWNAVSGATSYTLEEDDNNAFSSPETAYSGPLTSTPITGQDLGTYYYRVKATNIHGSSDWSNIQSTEVTQEPPAKDWMLQQTGTTENLNAVYFIDLQKGWVVGEEGLILSTSNGGGNWITQEITSTDELRDVFFLDSDQGWTVGGEGLILKTIDGGDNWVQIEVSSVSTYDLHAVHFVDDQNGWIVGGKVYIRSLNPLDMWYLGAILVTEDGGDTWAKTSQSPKYWLQDVFFIDPFNGWTGGHQLSSNFLYDIPRIMKSSNGGDTFLNQPIPVTMGKLYGLDFVAVNTGWVVGYDQDNSAGMILHTSDGGATWEEQISNTSSPIYAVDFLSNTAGWAVASDSILKTTNGGSNWAAQSADPACKGLRDLYFVGLDNGWIVGDGGVVCTYQKTKMSENDLNK